MSIEKYESRDWHEIENIRRKFSLFTLSNREEGWSEKKVRLSLSLKGLKKDSDEKLDSKSKGEISSIVPFPLPLPAGH
jgi:hypothetical protein